MPSGILHDEKGAAVGVGAFPQIARKYSEIDVPEEFIVDDEETAYEYVLEAEETA